ncbi:hypothetical protein [Sulfitobacter phage vB_SupP_AX]|nr:hypothetical protein [Sulfitobacter phage vB_SupP_AX]
MFQQYLFLTLIVALMGMVMFDLTIDAIDHQLTMQLNQLPTSTK